MLSLPFSMLYSATQELSQASASFCNTTIVSSFFFFFILIFRQRDIDAGRIVYVSLSSRTCDGVCFPLEHHFISTPAPHATPCTPLQLLWGIIALCCFGWSLIVIEIMKEPISLLDIRVHSCLSECIIKAISFERMESCTLLGLQSRNISYVIRCAYLHRKHSLCVKGKC